MTFGGHRPIPYLRSEIENKSQAHVYTQRSYSLGAKRVARVLSSSQLLQHSSDQMIGMTANDSVFVGT